MAKSVAAGDAMQEGPVKRAMLRSWATLIPLCRKVTCAARARAICAAKKWVRPKVEIFMAPCPPVHAGGFLLAGHAGRRSITAIVIAREREMASGTVKWFNGQKGYGFIQPDTG